MYARSEQAKSDQDRILQISANEAFQIVSGGGVWVIVANEGEKTHIMVSRGKEELLYAAIGKITKEVRTTTYGDFTKPWIVFDEDGNGVPEKRLRMERDSPVLEVYKGGSFETAVKEPTQ
jgi:hypothetical protein